MIFPLKAPFIWSRYFPTSHVWLLEAIVGPDTKTDTKAGSGKSSLGSQIHVAKKDSQQTIHDKSQRNRDGSTLMLRSYADQLVCVTNMKSSKTPTQ